MALLAREKERRQRYQKRLRRSFEANDYTKESAGNELSCAASAIAKSERVGSLCKQLCTQQRVVAWTSGLYVASVVVVVVVVVVLWFIGLTSGRAERAKAAENCFESVRAFGQVANGPMRISILLAHIKAEQSNLCLR